MVALCKVFLENLLISIIFMLIKPLIDPSCIMKGGWDHPGRDHSPKRVNVLNVSVRITAVITGISQYKTKNVA